MDNILSRANIKFNKRRRDREALIERRKEELYSRIPEIITLEQKISECSYGAFSAVVNEGVSPDSAVSEFKSKLETLALKRKELMRKHGYGEDYLEPPFICEKCKDRGIVNGELCNCYKELVSQELYKDSNLGEILKKQTFDKFDINFYDNTPQKGLMSPRENMIGILQSCKRFVRDFGETEENLLLYGAPGLGKTFLSSAIANSLIENGVDVFYQSAGQIFTSLENLRFGKSKSEADDYLAERIFSSELLIIDDLGTEFLTTASASELFRIINTRILNGKSTIISTNLSLGDIKKNYSERVLSRIMGHFTQLKFYGEDIRCRG